MVESSGSFVVSASGLKLESVIYKIEKGKSRRTEPRNKRSQLHTGHSAWLEALEERAHHFLVLFFAALFLTLGRYSLSPPRSLLCQCCVGFNLSRVENFEMGRSFLLLSHKLASADGG